MDTGKIRRKFREILSQASDKTSRLRLKYPLALVILAAAAIFWTRYFTGFLMVAVTAVVGILVKKADLNKLGIETATFFTVLSGYHFGPETGAILGFFLILAQVFTGTPGAYILWVVPAFVTGGYLAGIFSGHSITILGPAIAAGLQSIFVLFTIMISPEKLAKYTQYAVFNFGFNLILFNALGPIIIQMLGTGPIY